MMMMMMMMMITIRKEKYMNCSYNIYVLNLQHKYTKIRSLVG